jgi:hypothetical protein
MKMQSGQVVITLLLFCLPFILGGDCGGEDAGSSPPPGEMIWVSLGGPMAGAINVLLEESNRLWAGCSSGNLFFLRVDEEEWILADSLPWPIHALALNESGTMIAATGENPFYSNDHGVSWTQGLLGLPGYASETLCLAVGPPGLILAGTIASDETSGGVSGSTDNGETWELRGLERRHVYSLRWLPSGMLVASSRAEFPSPIFGDGVFTSADSGMTWIERNLGLPDETVLTLSGDSSTTLFAGTENMGIYKSTDSGSVWTQAGLVGLSIRMIVVGPSGNLFAATASGVYMSTNGGYQWNEMNSGLTDLSVHSLAVDPNGLLYAGTETSGVFQIDLATIVFP